jgi:diaminopimelate epimerase
MPPSFIKFHGFGNDYIVIEAERLAPIASLGNFARQICNRHYGAGADGIAVVSPSLEVSADFRVRIFNPDGSEAALSGNGTRCAAAYLFYQNLWEADELRLHTRSGVKRYFIREVPQPGKFIFDSELGKPRFASDEIPMQTAERLEQVVNYPLAVGDQTVRVTALEMGNPNCCIFVDNFSDLDWRALGPQIENHAQFPDRTNVTFVQVRDRSHLELRIWERGVGESTASGSCSCAAAVAAMINGKTERRVKVVTPGGTVQIHWREDDEVVITGSAEVAYAGDWLGTLET